MWVSVAEYNINYLYRCKVTDSAGNVVYSDPAAVKTGQVTWKNTYNADGLRTQRTDGYTTYTYYYTGDKLTYMTVGDDVLRFSYDANGAPLCVQWNNSRYFYVTNLQGDVVALVSINGIPVVEYTYDAWGNILAITGTRANNLGKLNPLRYRGYIYDTETELYYLQSRYYDPEICRFLNADAFAATGQGLVGNNMFAYCGNNPVSRVDENGKKYSSTEIHNFVLEDICEKHPTMTDKDTHMKYKKPFLWHTYGFCDLYDRITGEVWEAKRFCGGVTCTKTAAQIQLNNYVDNGVLSAQPKLKLVVGGTYTVIEPNVFEKKDKDMQGTYVITYWDAGDGVIFYDYYYLPSLEEIGNVIIGTLAVATYLGLAYMTGGASIGIPLPA